MTNLDIRQFRDNIIQYINSSALPVEMKRLILKEILDETTKTADSIIRSEFNEARQVQGKNEQQAQEETTNTEGEE